MTLATPNNQMVNGYTYDDLNRLASLAHNGIKQITATNIYNTNGKLASVSATESGATRSLRSFTYDSEQRLAAINGSYNSVQKLALIYAYNDAQQITKETACNDVEYGVQGSLEFAGVTSLYDYDNAQNRLSKIVGTTTPLTIDTNTPPPIIPDPQLNLLFAYNPPDTYGYTFANKLTNIYIGAARQ